MPLPQPATRCPAADARRWSSCRPRCRHRVQRTALALERMMSCQSACGAHAQTCRAEALRTPGASPLNLELCGLSFLNRFGSGLRQSALSAHARTSASTAGAVRAGPFGCAFTSRCGSLWGARATRADQQCVSVHARESYIVCATCANEFRVRPTGHCHPYPGSSSSRAWAMGSDPAAVDPKRAKECETPRSTVGPTET